MNRGRFEEIRKKYLMAKQVGRNIDLLSLKLEIESYIGNLRATDKENVSFLVDAQDMLIDVIRMIEESHCQPFKSDL